jgi:hypothetical protein
MIGIIFEFGSEVIEVRIDGNDIMFRTDKFGGAFVPIEGLQFSKEGVVKEHPDLAEKENWKEEAINRFKNHIKKMDSEMQRVDYVVEELSKMGYKPKAMQRAGHRVVRL